MNKQELIDRLAKEQGQSKAEVKKVVDIIFQNMTNTLSNGDRVEIRGLGSFAVKEYGTYEGRNPKTGEVVKVKRKKLPFFRVGKELKKRVDFK